MRLPKLRYFSRRIILSLRQLSRYKTSSPPSPVCPRAGHKFIKLSLLLSTRKDKSMTRDNADTHQPGESPRERIGQWVGNAEAGDGSCPSHHSAKWGFQATRRETQVWNGRGHCAALGGTGGRSGVGGSGGRGFGELLSETQAANASQAGPKTLASTLWPWGVPQGPRGVTGPRTQSHVVSRVS